MSSRFVSAGTNDAPIERDDAWLAAQKELDANQRRKAEEAQQPQAKSLYEALQANNAAKQEAFEEAAKLKNQFRALDEDEVEFLDSVLESTRAEEERVKKETAEGLQAFRKQQEEADKKLRAAQAEGDQPQTTETAAGEEEWTASGPRKRKRVKEKEGIRGLKLRKASTSEGEQSTGKDRDGGRRSSGVTSQKAELKAEFGVQLKSTIVDLHSDSDQDPTPSSKKAEPPGSSPKRSKSGLGLVDYGSDED